MPFVELAGDMIHWYRLTPLARAPGGWHEVELRLPAGCYGYKFRTGDGEWLLDPENPRTRGCDGVRNSVLLVSGSAEPVLHAAGPPLLSWEPEGRAVLRAGLRRGQGAGLRISWDEGHGERLTTMRKVAEEDEHELFETFLPVTAAAFAYTFLLDDGRRVGRDTAGPVIALRGVRPRPLPTPPDWWRDAAVYTVLLDRFRRGGGAGSWGPDPPAPGERRRAGGDLEGVREALPYLQDLGVTVLHLTPFCLSGSAHRYDATDPRQVDPALGGEPALRRLLAEARHRGLRVIGDIGLTHVHRSFAPFQDVARHGPRSRYWSWFHPYRFPFQEGPDPGYAHYREENWDEPLLRLEDDEVQQYLSDTFQHWTACGLDGFRLDAAAEVPLALCRRLGEAVRQVQPEAVLFAELIPDNGHRYRDAGGLDAVTEFVDQQALYDWLWRGTATGAATARRLAWRRFWRGAPGHATLGFVGTQDQPRLGTLVGDRHRTRLGLLCQLLRVPVPLLLYGDEVGLRSGVEGQRFEDVWPDRRPLPWDEGSWDLPTRDLVRQALRLRRERAALRRGDEEYPVATPAPEGTAPPGLLLVRRRLGEEVLDLFFNGGEAEARVALPAGAPSAADLLLTTGEATLRDEQGPLQLGPWSGAVLARRLPRALAQLWTELLPQGAALAAQAYRSGKLTVPALPGRLYVTVTEGCNLRCPACINDSPGRQARGEARSLTPWLLARLAPALGAADYLGLTGGGESLTSPLIWDLLRLFRQERGRRPGQPHVHLLSNGMLLTPTVAARLVDEGVTSLGVSLDGATAATNDRLRLGGDLARITAHLAALLDQRARTGADLRVGVSFTLMRDNLTELPAMGRLARGLGLDWLKVEELFPANAFARAQLVSPAAAEVREGLATLREVLVGSPVVLVDHLAPPPGCRCQAAHDPTILPFRDADDFANRATFHPCRMAWEQAWIEPDGLVRPVDHHHPPAGLLDEQPLLELWNGPVLQQVRRQALAAVPGELRRRCPDEPGAFRTGNRYTAESPRSGDV